MAGSNRGELLRPQVVVAQLPGMVLFSRRAKLAKQDACSGQSNGQAGAEPIPAAGDQDCSRAGHPETKRVQQAGVALLMLIHCPVPPSVAGLDSSAWRRHCLRHLQLNCSQPAAEQVDFARSVIQ